MLTLKFGAYRSPKPCGLLRWWGSCRSSVRTIQHSFFFFLGLPIKFAFILLPSPEFPTRTLRRPSFYLSEPQEPFSLAAFRPSSFLLSPSWPSSLSRLFFFLRSLSFSFPYRMLILSCYHVVSVKNSVQTRWTVMCFFLLLSILYRIVCTYTKYISFYRRKCLAFGINPKCANGFWWAFYSFCPINN